MSRLPISALPALLLLLGLITPAMAGAPPENAQRSLKLLDLDGRTVYPLAELRERKGPTVYLFTRTDCPISNRFAPEVKRLHETFGPRGVAFKLVYADPDEAPEAIRKHLEEYGYTMGALRDVKHDLVRETGVEVTPEAVVYSPEGSIAYRGRINDRFVDFGKTRATATRHDLSLALESILSGEAVEPARTRAVGCFISDLKP